MRLQKQRLKASVWLEEARLTRIGRLVARRLLFPEAEIEDLLQEIRLTVWRAGERPLAASWIFRAAEHCAKDMLRKKRRQAALEGVRPSARATRDHELAEILEASVSRLPPELRRFYETRLKQGFSERETARRLGMSRKAVRRVEAYCRRLLSRGH